MIDSLINNQIILVIIYYEIIFYDIICESDRRSDLNLERFFLQKLIFCSVENKVLGILEIAVAL